MFGKWRVKRQQVHDESNEMIDRRIVGKALKAKQLNHDAFDMDAME